MTTKRCTECGEEKPLDDFYPAVSRGKGILPIRNHFPVSAACKECTCKRRREDRRDNPEKAREVTRRYNYKSQFGLTIEDYDQILASQNGQCAVCKTTDALTPRGNFNVDHSHTTGAIRGLLCQKCNMGLGHFSDDPELLRVAASYLERPPYKAVG